MCNGMSCVMRIPAIGKCKCKGADQYFLNPTTIFCGCTVRFVSDLAGNPEDKFCRGAAHMVIVGKNIVSYT